MEKPCEHTSSALTSDKAQVKRRKQPLPFPPPSFAVGRNCFNRFAFCTYSRSPDELPHYSRPFLTEQEARDERFRRDDEPDSTWRVDWESVGYDAIALVDAF